MFRLAASILYDEDESKDVVSEVFSRLMANDIALRPETAEAYLLTGVRNQCRNVIERKQVRERFLRLLSDEATEPTTTNGEQLRMSELMLYVEKHLSPLSQQIFRLRYLREMTCQEVACELGISRQTVHSHLRESLEKIRVYFKSIQ
jgi:RNA polymerase sigma-70 factor (ECF subfamily)